MRLKKSLLVSVVSLACLGTGPCSGWNDVTPTDPKLGQSLLVTGDPNAPDVLIPKRWPTCVVLQNSGPYAQIAFRDKWQNTKITQRLIPPNSLAALHIGPDDVEFMFYGSPEYAPPVLVERLRPCNLERYPGIIEP